MMQNTYILAFDLSFSLSEKNEYSKMIFWFWVIFSGGGGARGKIVLKK